MNIPVLVLLALVGLLVFHLVSPFRRQRGPLSHLLGMELRDNPVIIFIAGMICGHLWFR